MPKYLGLDQWVYLAGEVLDTVPATTDWRRGSEPTLLELVGVTLRPLATVTVAFSIIFGRAPSADRRSEPGSSGEVE